MGMNAYGCGLCGGITVHTLDAAYGWCAGCHLFPLDLESLVMATKRTPPPPDPNDDRESITLVLEPYTPTEIAPGVWIMLDRSHSTSAVVTRPKTQTG